VSRYMRPRSRRPGPSWRAFLRNQAMAFGHREYAEERSWGNAGLHTRSDGAQLERSRCADLRWYGLGSGAPVGLSNPPAFLLRP
jgi:hypothetical protein